MEMGNWFQRETGRAEEVGQIVYHYSWRTRARVAMEWCVYGLSTGVSQRLGQNK